MTQHAGVPDGIPGTSISNTDSTAGITEKYQTPHNTVHIPGAVYRQTIYDIVYNTATEANNPFPTAVDRTVVYPDSTFQAI